ncbi:MULTISPECIES: bifunctional precorrin-2 dehydrogenase/sirohydrochlorin ferrochelatase [unclassified Clostridioides]|uniref:precorrin-2 dehydrogenase/sirohydrochlorin ferrochelatase family protein n=1 Tax=unclassified Clostridioides TaxID=2635829 RepID=UPI001D0C66F5|nr:bifunctional precorrin-2 dehydrogenase/sirohydrochlorin ferrochelatase [Clostridioides sp. ES-S-0001-02]MCC0654354.1 bifunctional precorrin-2 dehydrogenase/sirohydrochlorin ferrochelatase [Clostridioides sp. ES-S-0001-03]MCC0658298.1 bifunctional precorrin-2 dehydrogenase/sirohydrochlorin ferrochelatase [Clostridioides sp. ES-S-0123-01]MCC0671671.1 bifunctional precorrin-2 dehydrogenase/sirohydrochlorin ferrochelatase [Clostridioides sp. ES-S-0145-01]MCC0682466.1 bifunctional precorrin-2 deh
MLYPINLKLDDLDVVIIGGGEVAYRKCKNFLDFNKSVTVVSKHILNKFHDLEGNINIIKDDYKEEYIESSSVIIAATDNRELNLEIGLYCRKNKKLVNVVDNVEISNFTVPSYVKRGDLLISVSTGGKSPSLSSKIKKELEEKYTEDYEEYLNVLGEIRKEVIKKYQDKNKRKSILNMLIVLDLDELKKFNV